MRQLIGDVIDALNGLAPPEAAEDWDNVGLLAGDPASKVQRVLVSIDLTAEAVQLALKRKCQLIVNHHPCIFPRGKGISRVVAGSPIFEALKNGIAVAAYHTNFDKSALEVIEKIASGLAIQARGRLIDAPGKQLMKLVAFVPLTHIEQVRRAMCEAGAGYVGNYDYCTFAVRGEGTFRGGESTKPFLGKPGKLEKAEEIRLETILPIGMEKKILKALIEAHPYEEVAYDLYPVKQPALSAGLVRGLGYGFWGEFTRDKPFPEFAKDVKRLFNVPGFWMTEPAPSKVRRVGFVAGKGASFVESASRLKCDVFITGEAGYHTALAAAKQGTSVIELGHRESERFFIATMKDWISPLGLDVEELEASVQRFWIGGTK